jgi:hypothetical protein
VVHKVRQARCLTSRIYFLQKQELVANTEGLEQRQQALTEASEKFASGRKKAALAKLLDKPWRHEQEAVSAAFSKWVRSALFDVDEQIRATEADESIIKLLQENEELQETVTQLEEDRSCLLDRENTLERTNADLEVHLNACNEIETQLRTEIEVLELEKKSLQQELASLKLEVQSIAAKSKEEAKEMESLIATREAELDQKENALLLREGEIQNKGTDASSQFEEANTRIRTLANHLHEKGKDLEAREAQLLSDFTKNENTQQRLQALAMQLQVKAEQLRKDQSGLIRA